MTTSPPSWPTTIPHDLDKALNDLATQRYSKSNADTWGVMQEWLHCHWVQVPEDLPMRPEQTARNV